MPAEIDARPAAPGPRAHARAANLTSLVIDPAGVAREFDTLQRTWFDKLAALDAPQAARDALLPAPLII